MRWNYRRRRGLELALCLLSICAARSEDSEIQPSDHGLANEEDPGDPSPAMREFFRGRPVAPRPKQQNATDPVWGVAGKVSPADPAGYGGSRWAILLAAGVVCGFVGVGLLLVAAAYTVRTSWSEGNVFQIGLGSWFQARWKAAVRGSLGSRGS
ncbi:hypothetical protein HPP92_015968 [Vanilla planifolia]|uniref:Uncharacterized protein n=1 Tax=Vanilla planifolia TaxID=51239 RepID=A0A835QM72_VANPL|nr:hypothetical protein HPP92_015968 [Vanilla planifolia]